MSSHKVTDCICVVYIIERCQGGVRKVSRRCQEGVKEVSSRGLLADSLQEVVYDDLIGTE